jgi:hypothetical protein
LGFGVIAALGLACQTPIDFAPPPGASAGAASLLLVISEPGEEVLTQTYEATLTERVDLSYLHHPDSRVELHYYACTPEGIAYPNSIERTCVPPTERRYRLDPRTGWTLDDGETALPTCTICEQFPLVQRDLSAAREAPRAFLKGGMFVDDDTVLVTATEELISGVTSGYSAWIARRGEPEMRRVTVRPERPLNGPPLSDLSNTTGTGIIGAGSDGLFRLALEGETLQVEELSPTTTVAGDCQLLGTRDELWVIEGYGGLHLRKGGQWSRPLPNRIATQERPRVDSFGDLAAYGETSLLVLGATGPDAIVAYRVNQAIEIFTYYAIEDGVGRDWQMPMGEAVSSVASLRGRGFVLGEFGGIIEVKTSGEPLAQISTPGEYGPALLRDGHDRLLITDRIGGIRQLYPDEQYSCPTVSTPPMRELLIRGDRVAVLGREGIEVSWLDLVPQVSCSLDPP